RWPPWRGRPARWWAGSCAAWKKRGSSIWNGGGSRCWIRPGWPRWRTGIDPPQRGRGGPVDQEAEAVGDHRQHAALVDEHGPPQVAVAREDGPQQHDRGEDGQGQVLPDDPPDGPGEVDGQGNLGDLVPGQHHV